MSDCESRSTGDFIGAGGGCPNTNPNHRDEGHTFVVDVPTSGSYEVQVRMTCAEFGGSQANASMRFRLFPSEDVTSTPLSQLSAPRPDTSICPSDGSGWSRGV